MSHSRSLFKSFAAVAVLALSAGLVLLSSGRAYGQAPGPDADAAPREAGTVEFVSGDSMITPKVGASRLAAKGGRVNEGDTVVTFDGAEAQLHMLDGAYLMVRENSRIEIQAYVADGGKDDRSILDLIKGTVRSITGWIGKYNRAAYEIRTPILVTIGVRGTDHEVTYIPPDDPRGKPGVYDKVNEGEVVMRSGGSVVAVPPNRAVYSAWGAKPHRPRLLASIPRFFRAGPHEREFARRARASMRTLGAQRQARIRAVRARREGRRGLMRRAPVPRPGLRPGARGMPGATLRERSGRAGGIRERGARSASAPALRGRGGLRQPGGLRERGALRERGSVRERGARGERARPQLRERGRR